MSNSNSNDYKEKKFPLLPISESSTSNPIVKTILIITIPEYESIYISIGCAAHKQKLKHFLMVAPHSVMNGTADPDAKNAYTTDYVETLVEADKYILSELKEVLSKLPDEHKAFMQIEFFDADKLYVETELFLSQITMMLNMKVPIIDFQNGNSNTKLH